MDPINLRLLCSLAHPDDESLGFGGTLARCADEGVETYLISATRGEYGWFGEPGEYPGPQALGLIRESELMRAAQVLKLQDVEFLGYIDGLLDQADAEEVIGKIAGYIRQVRPHVVLTFDPSGIYGHPDHIAIAQFTTAAVVAAANPDYPCDGRPYQVDKLYYRAWSQAEAQAYDAAFGDLVMRVDDVDRSTVVWPEWAITTRLDTAPYHQQVWQAVKCHRSQLPGYDRLLALPEEQQRRIFSTQTFYRAFSFVNGGRQVERDLFEGISIPVTMHSR
jgi:LmbE family N-acetylglucosaminyl deacetylase